MAFSSTLLKRGVKGDLQYRCYSYDAGTDTSGTITTDLSTIISATATNTVDENMGVTCTDVSRASTVAMATITGTATGLVEVEGKL